MKRISTIIMALVVVMTMAHCKKNSPITPDNQDNIVTITLDVKNNNGSRVDVNTITGTVDFETGDKVYVGSGGKYVGLLTHNGTNFVGNITNPTENQPLQFYFLGNVTPTETLSAGITEECSVIISDQTEHLPVISTAASNENYVSGVTSYTGHLLNKCALVKFNTSNIPQSTAITIHGMKNRVTVYFGDNSFHYDMIDESEGIALYAVSNSERWAILLPQNEMSNATATANGYASTNSFTVPTITNNAYLALGIDVELLQVYPTGAINGLFSVNANSQVYFSQGNLQFIGSANTPYWRFAGNQWDCFGVTTEQNSEEENVDRDLFGWGTSGHNHGAVCYQPWSASLPTVNYYAYGSPTKHLYMEPKTADWGYNRIINGGNTINSWRTLTKNEWDYVFNTRSTVSGIRYAKAQVNNVNGIILLPDNWEENTFYLYNTNTSEASYNSNIITESQWNVLEDNGAVFLPAAGRRYGTSIGWINESGRYFSASINVNNSSYAYAYGVFCFDSSFVVGEVPRSEGNSVRLVQDY